LRLLQILILSLCIALAYISMAGAFEPKVVETNPKLANFNASFSPPHVINVTDGIYLACGYTRNNPLLIEGTDGLIVVDPGESTNAANITKKAFNDHTGNIFAKKPVKAIIYTHHHDCHIHGASVYAGNSSPQIIAHENINKTLFYDWYGQLFTGRLVGGAMMAGTLFAKDPGYYSGGALFAVQVPGPSGYMPPTLTVKDKLDLNISGVHMQLYSVPGETRDVIIVWLPEKKLMVQIANFYEAFPAITTLRGADFRNPLDYVDSIDFYRSFNPEIMVLLHGPHPVLVGADNISRTLTNYRDAIQYIHDQTVYYMNRGLTPGEIAEKVDLPSHLASDPYLQETYGQVDRDIYEIFWWYRGYFDGKCRDLYPVSPKEEARMAVYLAGGVDNLASKAQAALDNGNTTWALVFSDDVLQLDPGNKQARDVKNASLIALAERTFNAQERNYLLSEYLLESGQVKMRPVGFNLIDDNIVPLMPMNAINRILDVRLNATRSVDKDVIAGLHLTNSTEPADYSLHVRYGILEVLPQVPAGAEFNITTEPMVWKDLVLSKLDPKAAVSEGKVTITGAGPEAFYGFFGLFD
jgi:alkyl sulfatase BDS1-like metallo-beta-lactamase superfamily hydrolase